MLRCARHSVGGQPSPSSGYSTGTGSPQVTPRTHKAAPTGSGSAQHITVSAGAWIGQRFLCEQRIKPSERRTSSTRISANSAPRYLNNATLSTCVAVALIGGYLLSSQDTRRSARVPTRLSSRYGAAKAEVAGAAMTILHHLATN